MKASKNQLDFIPYLVANRKALLQRDFLAEIFTLIEPTPLELIEQADHPVMGIHSRSKPYEGKIVKDTVRNKLQAVVTFRHVSEHDDDKLGAFYTVTLEDVPFKSVKMESFTNPLIEFTLKAGEIENYPKGNPIKTTVGRFIANYVIFASVFGDRVPYLNDIFKPGKVDGLLPTEDAALYARYVDHRQYLTACTEFYTNNLTPHALSTDRKIKATKAKDLKENEKSFVNNDPIKCSQLENKWMKMDHDYLKGDESNVFLQDKKLRTNSRKKMFITNGLRERFGSPGLYDFTPNSLEEAWTAEEFPALINEARMGSYNRARETAKGGEESKFIIRVFQNTRVTEDDCKTKHYYKVRLQPHNLSDYLGRNIVDNGKIVPLSKNNASKYMGKVISLRSPLYCTAKQNGYCFTCMGEAFSKTRQDAIASVMAQIGSQMLTNSLKSMHNSTTEVNKLKNLNEYILNTPK